MVKEITGNLLDKAENGEFDVICHGCNTFHKMESGIAKEVKARWPEAYIVDCLTPYGDKNKLGTISFTKNIPNLTIVNCYTQHNYGRDVKIYVDYDGVENSLREVKKLFQGKRIGIPKIGAGLARGDWNIIKSTIEKIFSDPDDDITVVIFEDDVKKNHNSNPAINKLSAFKQRRSSGIQSQPSSQSSKSSITQSTLKNKPIIPDSMGDKKFRGKRFCKVCHTKKSVKDMVTYVHGVWCCKDVCHDAFMKDAISVDTKVQMSKINSIPAPPVAATVTT